MNNAPDGFVADAVAAATIGALYGAVAARPIAERFGPGVQGVVMFGVAAGAAYVATRRRFRPAVALDTTADVVDHLAADAAVRVESGELEPFGKSVDDLAASSDRLILFADDRPTWPDVGSCATASIDRFDPETTAPLKLRGMRGICRGCPVKAECLAYSLRRPALSGYWAATSADDRATLRALGVTIVSPCRECGRRTSELVNLVDGADLAGRGFDDPNYCDGCR